MSAELVKIWWVADDYRQVAAMKREVELLGAEITETNERGEVIDVFILMERRIAEAEYGLEQDDFLFAMEGPAE